MKRCPQCEFIYEDDQSLCDMDGALLVLDSRTLPNLHALAPVDMPVERVASKAHWRHRTFPAMAALILATVLSLVYFVSSQRRPAPVNVPTVTLPASSLVAPAENKPTPEPPPATEANGAAPAAASKDSKPESKAPAAPPASKAASKPNTKTTQPKPAQESKKDDSKVGSILKKTGRILKKPFKL